jgi:mannose-6-phosphate isomerase-like protein (cupin superfamily)
MGDKVNFLLWTDYADKLAEVEDLLVDGRRVKSRLFAIENMSLIGSEVLEIPPDGAAFGFVISGRAALIDTGGVLDALAHQFFVLPKGGRIVLNEPGSRVVVMQRVGWRGQRIVGGPIESKGRLRYIDGCSDTCLVPPPLLGDACLNHLHFPVGIDQTEHTHPSVRMGCVVRGFGECVTPDAVVDLKPGSVFIIPTDGIHKFRTLRGEVMDVIAYHPDSDFGPTHETHPMVNRTWVGGSKIDNTVSTHIEKQSIEDTSIAEAE